MVGRDRLHRFGLLAHAGLGAVEFKEQGGLRLEPLELRVANARVHLHVIEQLDARDGDADLHRHDHRVDRALEVGKLADGRGDRFGYPIQAELHLGHDAERALCADVQTRQVIAGARFPRAAARADQFSLGSHDGEAQHVLAHRPVANGIGSRRACRGHAADRRVGTRIDRKEQSGSLELQVQLLAGDACLHAAIEIVAVHLEHTIHLREVDADASVERRDVSLERRADAEGDHRYARLVALTDDRRDLLVRAREHDDIRDSGVRETLAMPVLLAHRLVDDGALAVVAGERAQKPVDHVACRSRKPFRHVVHRTVLKSAAARDGGARRGARACGRIRRSARASGRPCRD